MNRAQFLAELTQYLTFVTPAEREKLITAFEEKFDDAGEDGEAALIMELGTPMSITIALKRRKENGGASVSDLTGDGGDEGGEAGAEDGGNQTQIPGFADEPTEAPPSVDQSPIERPMPEALPDELLSSEASLDDNDGISEQDNNGEKLSVSDEIFKQIAYEEIPGISTAGTAAQIEREAPTRKKITAGRAIGATFLSIIIAAIFFAPAVSGGYLLTVMAKFVIGALRNMSNITDALWLFSLGFIAGAIGLLVLWFFLWTIISIIRRLYLGKPFSYSAYRLGMKKIWKTVWILFAVFLILGLACGAISYGMGAAPSDLFGKPAYDAIFDWLVNNRLMQLILG